MNFIYLKQTDSTNNEIRRLNENYDLEHGFGVVTDFQTDGHGQASNKWESEDGKNLLFSMFLRPEVISPSEQFVITEFVTVAIINALQPETDNPITIKWPNDIYVDDNKLCGILIENSLCGNRMENSIVGIGININQCKFVSNAPNPVSLKQMTGRDHDRKELLQRISDNILQEYALLSENNTPEYRSALYKRYFSSLYRGTGFHTYSIPFTGERFKARIEGVGPQGHLTLMTDSGSRLTFAFKEVAFENITVR